MKNVRSVALLVAVALAPAALAGEVAPQVPAAIAAPGQTLVTTLHAEGAQIHECRAAADGKLIWQVREPIATLFLAGQTVGRHYAGPTWEYIDGSLIVGKVAAIVSGATANDVPWLRLDVVRRQGSGMLSGVTTVQRINTKGGAAQGPCDSAGSYLSVPYSADYVFLGKGA
jgi:hypothetical protein